MGASRAGWLVVTTCSTVARRRRRAMMELLTQTRCVGGGSGRVVDHAVVRATW